MRVAAAGAVDELAPSPTAQNAPRRIAADPDGAVLRGTLIVLVPVVLAPLLTLQCP